MTTTATSREGIRDTLASYCRGIDRRDRALVASCFTPHATDDHGTGPRPIPEFLDWCFALLDQYDSTFHFLGQSSYDFEDSDLCRVETYGVATHRRTGGAARQNLTTGFRYVDDLVRDASGWRIRERLAITDWSRVDDESAWFAVSPELARGQAGTDDPSYRR
jgi:hypothetical protein